MPAKQAGDSKQGLIIALVCFVLLSIILGVTTYMGYDGQTAKDTAAKEAKNKEDAAKKDRDWWHYRALEIQALAIGVPLKDEAARSGSDYSSAPLTGSGQTEFVNLLQSVGKMLTNDKNNQVDTYDAKVRALTSQLIATREQLAASEANLKKNADRYVAQLETTDSELNDTHTQLQKAQKANLDDQKAREAAFEARLAELEQMSTQDGVLKAKISDDAAAWEKERIGSSKRNFASYSGTGRQAIKLRSSPSIPLKFDQPKGKIISLDRRGDIAYVTIGSAQGIRPQQNLTFSVFAPGLPGHPNKDYKGSIEIIDVISAQVSKAKVITVSNPERQPVDGWRCNHQPGLEPRTAASMWPSRDASI